MFKQQIVSIFIRSFHHQTCSTRTLKVSSLSASSCDVALSQDNKTAFIYDTEDWLESKVGQHLHSPSIYARIELFEKGGLAEVFTCHLCTPAQSQAKNKRRKQCPDVTCRVLQLYMMRSFTSHMIDKVCRAARHTFNGLVFIFKRVLRSVCHLR